MSVSEALGWTLVHSLWQGVVIAAALALLIGFVRSPSVRYVAGCVAMLAMVGAFLITMIHFWPVDASGVTLKLRPEIAPWRRLSGGGGSNWEFPNLIPWLGPLWLAGVGVFYMRQAISWFSVRRMRKRGVCSAGPRWQEFVRRTASELRVSRPVVLLESLLADTPVVLGHFRPVILVPLGFLSGMPVEHVEAILLHELAHIRRCDYLVNIFQRMAEGLLFYHPVVWWISKVIRTERENCCDDVVVRMRGHAHEYAAALTALEQSRLEQQWATRETAVAATGGDLMKRIKRLLYPKGPYAKGPGGIWAPALTAVVLMASTAMVMSAWHLNGNTVQSQSSVQSPWQKWLNEDVVYIISDPEKAAFERLATDEERQHFVEQFWERRNPNPGSAENKLKEEHYRRIAYANSHWGKNMPGWKTDRGRVYIKFGPPDEIDSHPAGGNYTENGVTTPTYFFEDWRYAKFEGIGNLDIEFVDTTGSGELRMTFDPKEKYRK